MRTLLTALLFFQVLAAPVARAQTLQDIVNFRSYSDKFATAGQPTEAELETIRAAGYERVVNIAFSSDAGGVPNEDRLVRELGMDYVQIPVVWASPSMADFATFLAVMREGPAKKTLLHCQVNYRASAFGLLYRVLDDGVALAEAKADLNSVWTPNEIWRQFIFDVLEVYGVEPQCPGCDW